MKIYHVDAFTDKIFSGNPAGVCVLSELKDDICMQNVAGELNLSETAFLLKKDDGFNLRWFSPKREVDLCGHATLASAHVLWEAGILPPDKEARFFTKSGLLAASRKGDFIELNFPIEEDKETVAPKELLDGLKATPIYVGKNRMDYIVEVESEEIVRTLNPDYEMLKRLDARGVIVTSISNAAEIDFVSRFFAPAYGIPEDPVTGSAHCCLGPYWKRKLNRNEFNAFQASERGGFLKVRVERNRVFISGKAVTVFCAELMES
ncbi:MAG: oxidoreductase [Nitrospirae bacterium GWF2_44_13]|nr:MAG: oxidoreductase [Nitrospirae bacterium GWF2_44_13]OGW63685.1 MAG: oxidoreductase [Nitrospirae bacterium RIFOXYA2_FULL_44_9]HBG92929.1 oxidoreductase [Nitrospiraceae bacterium]